MVSLCGVEALTLGKFVNNMANIVPAIHEKTSRGPPNDKIMIGTTLVAIAEKVSVTNVRVPETIPKAICRTK
jgi:hypothetical protein